MKVNNLEFYTYPFYLNNVNYAIINCKNFIDFKKQKVNYELINNYSNQFDKVLLEPEVLILKKQSYFRFESWLNINEFLNNLPNNCFFTMDYPNDMNEKYSKLFINKTYENILNYSNSRHYVNTIQFESYNFESFKENYHKFYRIKNKSKILAIGNLCRVYSNSFKDKTFISNIFNYIKKNNKYYNWIHIYGLGLRYISLFYNTFHKKIKILSFDSTKWTKACNDDLKIQYGINCKQTNRQIFYNEYCKSIKTRILKL